jgi:type IV pilus assembly protein PilC
MPTFRYHGRRWTGEATSGERDADSASAVAAALWADRIVVVRLDAVEGRAVPRRSGRIPARALASSTRQLASLVEAGLPLVQALDLLRAHEPRRALADVWSDTRDAVARGERLSEALGRAPRVFSGLYVGLVACGEASGALDVALARLAAHLERQAELSARGRAALAYPAVVLMVTAAVVGFLVWKVVPEFATLFTALGTPLPTPTRMVIAASDALVRWAPVAVVPVAVAIVAASHLRRRPLLAAWFERLVGRLPVVGPVVATFATVRVSRALATLLTSGVSLIEALDISARAAGNAAAAAALASARARVARGEPLAVALGASGRWPPILVQMVAVGEATGSLHAMLDQASALLEHDVDRRIAALMALLEPALIVVLGVVVGGLVASLYLPLFNLVGRLS